MALRGRCFFALHRARIPPAPDFGRLGRVAHVDDGIDLVVLRVTRREIRRAAGAVDIFAVDEPKRVHAARMGTGAVEEGYRLGILRIGDIEQVDAGGLFASDGRLIGDCQKVAGHLQRIRAHPVVRQLRLADDLGLARIADVDAGEIRRCGFMRDPQYAPAVASDLHRHTFAAIAESAQIVMGDQFHVEGFVLAHGNAPALVSRV